MHLTHPFYRFPFRFDIDRLRAEVEAIPESSWRGHHEGFEGNSALTLITTNGSDNDDTEPPMRPTEHLLRSPYMMQVLAQFRTLHGRARLMRLAPRSGVPPHIDIQYYWRTRARVHIPVITHPEIRFRCGGEIVHMAEGEAWTFDNWRTHQVINETETRRIHLTFDTFGSAAFWGMARPHREGDRSVFVPYQADAKPVLTFETHVGDPAMPPGEVDYELSRLATDVKACATNDPAAVGRILALLAAFRGEWRLLWHAKGPTEKSLPLFHSLLRQFERECIAKIPETVTLASNGKPAIEILLADLAAMAKPPATPDKRTSIPTRQVPVPRFDRPVFIVSVPRAGSTMLFEMLATNEALWTLGGEGHEQVELIASLDPQYRDFHSNRLVAADASTEAITQLRTAYAASLCMADGTRYVGMGTARPRSLRLLEKTPKNALRIPFLRAAFPDAKFIFLHREAAPNISAIMEAWQSGRFVTYPELPGWEGPPWSLLLIPGWRELNRADLARIAMRQWRDTNETILSDIGGLPEESWISVRYEDILRDPTAALNELCAFADVPFDEPMRALAAAPLRWSRYTLSPPNSEKWRKNESALAPFLREAEPTARRLGQLSNQIGDEAAR
ncbi:MAG: sulfotransferase [Rhizomicrobium sp.]